MLKPFKRLLNSRKFIVAVTTVVLMGYVGHVLGVNPDKVFYVGIALIAGFGLADLGKEKK